MDGITAAVIDLGSNSIRMTIAEVYRDKGKSIKELADCRKTVRISEGMGTEMTIKPHGFAKTIAALKDFNADIEFYKADKVVAVSTEALRRAANSKEFIETVYINTGIRFEVISGEDEARYDFLGIADDTYITDCVLIDTGGGSCEIIHIKNGRTENIVSLPLGGVILTERFLEKDIVSASGLFNMFLYINSKLDTVEWLSACKGLPVLAIGGSNRAAGYVEKTDKMTADDIFRLYDVFLSSDNKTRKKLLKKYDDRADIIIGGMASLVCIIQKIASNETIISGKGIRDGILAEMKNNL